ncbi:MAG: metal-sulfur cluster assembly factor [Planctomycetota bacterium]|nr:metal-sulfur cluster assembly factor [Planctomycetota bacterium]MEE2739206.1 metal-sulfur cluster assembly factor [Planctomycetota bacterium]
MPDEIEILETLKQVNDPELMVNIVDLGLIYNVSVNDNNIEIEMTLTSPACPAGPQIINQSKSVLSELENVEEVQVNLVMTPPWTPERMTEDARDQLGMF